MAMVVCRDCKMLGDSDQPTCPYCGSSNRQSAFRAETLFVNLLERIVAAARFVATTGILSARVWVSVLGAVIVLVLGGLFVNSLRQSAPHAPAISHATDTLHWPAPSAVATNASAPSVHTQPMVAAFSIAVARTGSDLMVTGRTNLPAQTQLSVTVSAVAGRTPAGTAREVTVEPDGVFDAGPFGWMPHADRPPGKYRVDIVATAADAQPDGAVKIAAGPNWSKYTGALMGRSGDGAKRVPEAAFEFSYDGTKDFSFWKDMPAGASKPPLNVTWTKDSLASLIAAKRDLTSPTWAATMAANQLSGGAPIKRVMLIEHYGCVDKEFLEQLKKYQATRDKQHWDEAIEQATATGRCTLFAPGDEVVVIAASASGDLIRVRRVDRFKEYWIDPVGMN